VNARFHMRSIHIYAQTSIERKNINTVPDHLALMP
jgi:hypothetical protein